MSAGQPMQPAAANTSPSSAATAKAEAALSYPEFRALYEAELRRRRERGQLPVPAAPPAPPPVEAGVAAAAQPMAPPPLPQPQPQPQRRGGRVQAIVGTGAQRAAAFLRHAFPSWDVALRICLACVMFTGRITTASLLIAAGAYVAFTLVKHLLSTVQLRRRREGVHHAGPQGPTPIGQLFLQLGGAAGDRNADAADQPQARPPVSFAVKAGYRVVKCAEAFVLSFYPFYSVENLEMELLRDGIVYDNTPARPQEAAPEAFPRD